MPSPESSADAPVRLCFVCLGNICRSPTAEGVMAALVAEAGLADRILVDSAGTGAWHVGEPADSRSVAEASRRGVELVGRARQFRPEDLDTFDLIVAMDQRNLRDVLALVSDPAARDKVRLLRSFDPAEADSSPSDLDVPDPYFDRDHGFAIVFDQIDAACRGLLDHVRTVYL